MPSDPPAADHPQSAGERAEALLKILAELLAELHPERRGGPPPSLDAALDRDLGIDSLARMELLSRIESGLGAILSEQALIDAETARDLLRSLGDPALATAPRRGVAGAASVAAGALEVPVEAPTIAAVLETHAGRHPQRRHIVFYAGDAEPETLTYGALRERGGHVAAALLALGLEPGQAVGLMLPTSLDYFAAFSGILLAGGVPVPLYPPVRRSQIEDHLRRQAGILTTAEVRYLISFDEVLPLARLLQAQVASLSRTLTVPQLERQGQALPAPSLPRLTAEAIAFLQFTSGSTGQPKGVVLSHANLLANLRSMGQALGLRPGEDVVVSWLPLYHDMGLIGAWMGSLYFGMTLVLMSPLAFLSRPVRWLRALSRHRGTVSAAPNFAYELCVQKIEEADLEGIDLSSWRLALNGAEPVSAETLRRFSERFAPLGFRPGALTPVYGLAENSLGVAFPPPGRGPRVEAVRRDPLMTTGRALTAAPGETDVLRFVGAGFPIPHHEVRIVDAGGQELPERREGRLEFRGPSATSGYFRNPEATRKLLDGEWRDSGDLAFVAEGEIFITGRAKDVIIRAGRNIYPQELEEAVGQVPGVRKGCVAVFGSLDPDNGTERLLVLAETREDDGAAHDELRRRIQQISVDLLGIPADEVVLAPPHTVPKTSSGKIRRAASRELYEAGRVGSRQRGLWWQVARLALSGLAPQLRRRGRALGAWLFAGYAWALFALLAVPGWLAIVALPTLGARRRFARGVSRLLATLSATPLSVTGAEHLETTGGCVVTANHASYLDAFALTATLPPRFAFVAKVELARSAWVRLPLARLSTLFVERFDVRRSVEDARRTQAALAGGEPLVYFPEGTFDRSPGLRAFRMGAFVAAAEAAVPVVPVVIRGTRSMLRAGEWLPRRGAIEVEILAPVSPAGAGWEAAVALRDAVRARMLARCGEPDRAGTPK